MLNSNRIAIRRGMPSVVLAPMDGLADAPMRALQGELGAFDFCVSEFVRVSGEVPGRKVFLRDVPELATDASTRSGLPVQVQLLGGHPGRMAEAAWVAYTCGATAIDINFGCPAPTVNRHDGGATLLKYPLRIKEIVAEVRDVLPSEIPVSAKLRLGWDSVDSILENACMAEEGGASWVTIHGRTKLEGYKPPAHWEPIGKVNRLLSIPVVANGDIMSIDSFYRCQDITGCEHYMLGRGAIADPSLSFSISNALGLSNLEKVKRPRNAEDWIPVLHKLLFWIDQLQGKSDNYTLARLKQWLNIARMHGQFDRFDAIKRAGSVCELFDTLGYVEVGEVAY